MSFYRSVELLRTREKTDAAAAQFDALLSRPKLTSTEDLNVDNSWLFYKASKTVSFWTMKNPDTDVKVSGLSHRKRGLRG